MEIFVELNSELMKNGQVIGFFHYVILSSSELSEVDVFHLEIIYFYVFLCKEALK